MLEIARKKPNQARAINTVETLLDAAAQVLEHEDEKRFTTNRIAEVAGFSIGTLYQYFPNKNAVLRALAARERERVKAIFHRAIVRGAPEDIDGVVRIVIRTCLDVLGGRRRARRVLMIRMIRLNQGIDFLRGTDELTMIIIDAMTAQGLPGVRPLSATAGFILTRAIIGCDPIRGAGRKPVDRWSAVRRGAGANGTAICPGVTFGSANRCPSPLPATPVA